MFQSKDPIVSKCLWFCIGAAGYPLLELAFRGRTHFSMALAGGASLCLVRRLNRALKKKPLLLRGAAGAFAITGVELLTGLAFNRRYQVWDYRSLPVHYKGQVCPYYTCLWFFLCLGLIPCLEFLENP